jgi:hypothetical protein
MELGYVREWDKASSPRIILVSFSFHGILGYSFFGISILDMELMK